MFDEEAALAAALGEEPQAEESLGEAVEKFDLQRFIEGARSARATVRLYSRPDLDEEIGLIRQDLFEAAASGDHRRQVELKKRLEDAQHAYFAQSIDLVIEERSKDWQARQTKAIKEARPDISRRDLTLELVARQIIAPYRFTGRDLSEIAEVIPSQVNRVIRAWAELQQVSPEEARVLPAF